MLMKYRPFGKKRDDCPSLIISEIIPSKTGGYLNVKKVLLENTIRKSTW